jgi:hypothetical protein
MTGCDGLNKTSRVLLALCSNPVVLRLICFMAILSHIRRSSSRVSPTFLTCSHAEYWINEKALRSAYDPTIFCCRSRILASTSTLNHNACSAQ